MANAEATAVDQVLTGVSARDRQNIEKHLAACDAEPNPGHAKLWRRLALMLRKLAPMPVNTVGQQVVQFFVPDGKYRMQVFALEDKRDGQIILYLPDVIEAGIKAKILGKPTSVPDADPDEVQPIDYPIRSTKGQALRVEALTNTNLPDPPPYMRHMLGWNRKAVRVTFPAGGAPTQVEAVEALVALAAKAWESNIAAMKAK